MFGKVAAFEFRYQLRQPSFWVISILFFLLSFSSVASPNISVGSGGNVFKNAPFAIAQAHLIFNLFFMLATTAIVANVVVRDASTGFGPMIQSSRLSKFDYLYGRLLAVAHWAEQKTRNKDESPRPTNAERFMTKFAASPYVTWPFISKKLEPYLCKLQSNVETIGWYNKAQWAFQEIHNAFAPDDYASNKPLEGEFLLGYHCQISALYTGKPKKTDEQDKSTEE